MGSLPPPVVAVVVVRDPGPWFEEVLEAFANQDYGDLSVLILDAAGAEDPTARVAAVLPDAWVRRLPENLGFGASANTALSMVEGAAYLLFCHDDVAPDPDAVHQLVEEAFRSNAGIVAPKIVSWEDEERLLHVGMGVDKAGAVVDRVSAFEIDAGQHDAVRDVFVAPGGFTLIRADLFAEIGGFDPAIFLMGEDLDLCWRAQVAGARVVVAPDARVRHRELLASGTRLLEVPPEHNPRAHHGHHGDRERRRADRDGRPARPDGHRDHALFHRRSADQVGSAVTLQELQRRHELRAVFKCYSLFHLARVVPQIAALAFGEVTIAVVAGRPARARAIARAWWWNIRGLRKLRPLRRQLRGHRALHDSEIRRLQLRGSARLTQWLRRLVTHGFHGDTVVGTLVGPAGTEVLGSEPRTPTEGAPDGPGRVEAPVGGLDGTDAEPLRRATPASARLRLVVWSIVIAVLVFGSRQLLGGSFPVIGQFAPFPDWSVAFGRFVSGWPALAGGPRSPATPAYGFLGVLGLVLFASAGLAQQVCILGCLPLGAWGVSRLLRPTRSSRARLVATVAYLALPLPYEDIAAGRWQSLVLYAAVPWLFLLLVRAVALAPFEGSRFPPGRLAALFAPAQSIFHGARSDLRGAPSGQWAEPGGPSGWRRSLVGCTLLMGVVEAVVLAFAPAVAAVVGMMAVGLAIGSAFSGELRQASRALVAAAGATAIAVGLCFPWLIATLASGRGALGVLGLPMPTSALPGWGDLLRFSIGPAGSSPLDWGFALAALVPLFVADRWRLAWAGRCWVIALVAWVAAWVVDRGWTGGFAVAPDAWLVPAGIAVCVCLGLGVVAFEQDLPAHRFGWRQVVTGVAVVAVVVASLPTLTASVGGRWGLPPTGDDSALSWLSEQASAGSFGVLWLGDPRAVPGGSWAAPGDLSVSLTATGVPGADQLWVPAGPGRVADALSAVTLAEERQTTRVGALLQAENIRYLVLVSGMAPTIVGAQEPLSLPLPANLVSGLAQQLDLRQETTEEGITVFDNTDWSSGRSRRAPSDIVEQLGAAGEVLLWIVSVAVLAGPRWWRDWWWLPLRRRRARRGIAWASDADADVLERGPR